MKHIQPIMIDGGEVHILPTGATYTWGSWQVTWPKDFEAPELEDGHQLGFVAQLPEEPAGRFAREFVRADARINAVEQWSNVEEILDRAREQTRGEVVFERDVDTTGLGRLTPGRDFKHGDIVPIRLWSRVEWLPVTEIVEESRPGAPRGWKVHLGGQLIKNDVERVAAAVELERAVARERAARAGEVDRVQKDVARVQVAASWAQVTADDAVARVGRVEQRAGSVEDRLQQTVSRADFSAYDGALQTRLWGDQGEINRLNEAFRQQQSEINRLTEETLSAHEALLEVLEKELIRASEGEVLRFWAAGPSSNADWEFTGDSLVAVGDWTGSFSAFTGSTTTIKYNGRDGYENLTFPSTRALVSSAPTPRGERSWPAEAPVSVEYVKAAGRFVKRSVSSGQTWPAQSQWQFISAMDVTVSETAECAISYQVMLAAATYHDRYGLSVRAGSRVLKEQTWTQVGPLLPLGDGRRRLTLAPFTAEVKAGETVRFYVYSTGDYESQRRVESAEATVSWVAHET